MGENSSSDGGMLGSISEGGSNLLVIRPGWDHMCNNKKIIFLTATQVYVKRSRALLLKHQGGYNYNLNVYQYFALPRGNLLSETVSFLFPFVCSGCPVVCPRN